MQASNGSIIIVRADYANAAHAQAIVALMDEYARGASGGGETLPGEVKDSLVSALAGYTSASTVLAYDGDKAVGLLNAFETLSTFRARPLLNIHDVVVTESQRGRGIARKLFQAIEEHALTRGCCKLTLEVLEGNRSAQKLYRDLGFAGYSLKEEFGEALFWQKLL